MDIQPERQPRELMGVVVRWGLLLLVAGMALVYLLLSQSIARRATAGLMHQQLNGQEALARSMASLLDQQVRQGKDLESAFSGLSEMMALQFGSTGGGLSLVDPDGEIISQRGTSEFQPLNTSQLSSGDRELSLDDSEAEIAAQLGTSEKRQVSAQRVMFVRDPRTATSLPYQNYLRLNQPTAGLLYSGAGTSQRQSVAISKIAVNNWALLVHRSTSEIEDSLSTIRLYLLVAFLCLAILLMLFVLRFYYSLAGVFYTAVQSANSLNSASQAFQESVGVMRSPLHNIQGLTDLLCMAADEDERERYAGEIKAEVGKIIKMFKKSEY